jgi:hypothetical protein
MEETNQPKINPDKSYYDRLKPLRTYQGDVSDAIGKTKASVVSIAVAEQKRKIKIEPTKREVSEVSHEGRNSFFIFAGTIFFALGIAVIGVFYYFSLQNKVMQIAQDKTILNYDQEVQIPIAGITHGALVQKILDQEKSFNLPANSVLYLNTIYSIGTSTSPSDPQTALQILAPHIPAELLRNLSQNYMMGIYSFDQNRPFIILTVDDYGAGFSGMLEWEGTMVSDLGSIFNIAMTSSPSGGYVFTDESLSNNDLRIVQNSDRQTVLLYSLINKNTVIITGNESTFSALLNKYLVGQTVK